MGDTKRQSRKPFRTAESDRNTRLAERNELRVKTLALTPTWISQNFNSGSIDSGEPSKETGAPISQHFQEMSEPISHH